jgi:hypothetical protein
MTPMPDRNCPDCGGTGGLGWLGDVGGGMPWTPCETCWPRDADGEFIAVPPYEYDQWLERTR